MKKKANKREMFDDPVPLDENDPEIQEEMFETFKDLGWGPLEIKDKKLRGLYEVWLQRQK